MKIPILFLRFFIGLLLVSGCSDPGATDSLECVSGLIVGNKCGVYALKLDKRHNVGLSRATLTCLRHRVPFMWYWRLMIQNVPEIRAFSVMDRRRLLKYN